MKKKTKLLSSLLAIGLLGIGGFSLAALDDSAFSYKGTGEAGVIYTDTEGNQFPMGTITITSGNESITILDRNLGATATGYGADSTMKSYGYYFQRGNNYGFATSGTILSGNASDARIDATLYGPDNPYTSGIFLKNQSVPYDWVTTRNNNLRGGSGDTTAITKVTNPEERQGPCPKGYHVPSYSEWQTLINWIGSSNLKIFREKLYIPNAGFRYYFSASPYQGSIAYLLSSSPNGMYSRFLRLTNSDFNMGNGLGRAYGFPVRCFYDSSSTVFQSFSLNFTGSEGGSLSTGSIEAEKGSSISRDDKAGAVQIGDVTVTATPEEGYAFSGWLTDCDGDTVTTGCSFTSVFKTIPYTITYLGTGDDYVPSATGFTIKSDDIPLSDPSKTGYTFTGRSGTNIEGITGTVTISEGSTGDRIYEANWEANEYEITIDIDGNETILTGKYGDPISKPADPFKNGYKFIGWEPEFPTTMPLSGATVKAKWEKLGSSGGGGGRSSKTSSNSEKSTEGQAGNQQPLSPQQASDSSPNREQTVTPLIGGDGEARGGSTQNYTPEFISAYEFAHEKGITTMPTIQEAQMNGKLTRIAMAKMLSQYAMNVLGQKPANIVTPKFNDVTDKQNSDYDDGVTLAYQLGIMGQNMPNNKFRPDDEVTRAEFATALSRMAYGTSDGEYKGTGKYYIHHMEKLVKEGIITNDNPTMKELRGYVMIMLKRSAK